MSSGSDRNYRTCHVFWWKTKKKWHWQCCTPVLLALEFTNLAVKNGSTEVRLTCGCQAPVPHPAVWVDKPRRLDNFRYWQVHVMRVAYSGCDAAEPRKGAMNLQGSIRDQCSSQKTEKHKNLWGTGVLQHSDRAPCIGWHQTHWHARRGACT